MCILGSQNIHHKSANFNNAAGVLDEGEWMGCADAEISLDVAVHSLSLFLAFFAFLRFHLPFPFHSFSFHPKKVVYKLDSSGSCINIQQENLGMCKEFPFTHWKSEDFRRMAVSPSDNPSPPPPSLRRERKLNFLFGCLLASIRCSTVVLDTRRLRLPRLSSWHRP